MASTLHSGYLAAKLRDDRQIPQEDRGPQTVEVPGNRVSITSVGGVWRPQSGQQASPARDKFEKLFKKT